MTQKWKNDDTKKWKFILKNDTKLKNTMTQK